MIQAGKIAHHLQSTPNVSTTTNRSIGTRDCCPPSNRSGKKIPSWQTFGPYFNQPPQMLCHGRAWTRYARMFPRFNALDGKRTSTECCVFLPSTSLVHTQQMWPFACMWNLAHLFTAVRMLRRSKMMLWQQTWCCQSFARVSHNVSANWLVHTNRQTRGGLWFATMTR